MVVSVVSATATAMAVRAAVVVGERRRAVGSLITLCGRDVPKGDVSQSMAAAGEGNEDGRCSSYGDFFSLFRTPKNYAYCHLGSLIAYIRGPYFDLYLHIYVCEPPLGRNYFSGTELKKYRN